MTPLQQLAARLRLNAASMEHGETESDIRAAAEILDTLADATNVNVAYAKACCIARWRIGELTTERGDLCHED